MTEQQIYQSVANGAMTVGAANRALMQAGYQPINPQTWTAFGLPGAPPQATPSGISPMGAGEQERTAMGDVFQRYIQDQGLGNASPLAQRAMNRQAPNLLSQYQMSGAGLPAGESDVGTSFYNYLQNGFGAAPSQTDMRANLNNIVSTLGIPVGERKGRQIGLGAAFGEGYGSNVLDAAMQPYLSRVAPGMQRFFEQGAEDIFNRRRATNPEENFLNYAQSQKWF